MRPQIIAAAALLAAAACTEVANPDAGPVLARRPDCPVGAEEAFVAKCDPAVDKECSCAGYAYCVAYCRCTGYWETDAILFWCDIDGGVDMSATDGASTCDGPPRDLAGTDLAPPSC